MIEKEYNLTTLIGNKEKHEMLVKLSMECELLIYGA